MNKKCKRISILLLLSLCFTTCAAAEPTNLAFKKSELRQYYDSGQYFSDIKKVTQYAKMYLSFRITENNKSSKKQKLAIVLDIDETALSNYPDLIRLDFGGQPYEKATSIIDAHDEAISPVRALFNFAKKSGVAVFFISERKQNMYYATIKNLQTAGYHHWDGLYMLPDRANPSSFAHYKRHCRSLIEEMGYDIVLNMSDQLADLRGEHQERAFKLPNPFYYQF